MISTRPRIISESSNPQGAGSRSRLNHKPSQGLSCWLLSVLLLAGGVLSCAPPGSPIPEAEYRAKLVGDWQGTVGEMKETISFRADGGFTSQVRPMGFISNTLGQGVTGTVRGTWTLQGKIITLNITGAENEKLLNSSTASTIESFKPNELVVKSARGETSTFVRAL
jgi:hypothetical protein